MKRAGIVFVVSAPSGAGKTTVIREFLKKHKRDFVLSVSATTRPPRNGEKDGRDYYFFSEDKFKKFIEQGKFLEHARVVGNRYGTLKKTVINSAENGKNVIMDVDVQGMKSIKKRLPESVAIFLKPPSFEELKKRLEGRKTESRESLAKRLKLAKKELKEEQKYDYIVVNKELGKAVEDLEEILKIERQKRYQPKEAFER
ncbi:MAG TPA: guanylate kinase [bacterium]|nr:guanylate kinase [bacterium]